MTRSNAAYAADGYARVKQAQLNQDHEGSQADSKPGQAKSQGGKDKTQGGVRGLGALLTTQGVGELSAINGIAGAYAERVPVLHVVGVASTKLQKSRAVLHHTLGDGLTRVFEEAHSGITCARAFLQGAEDAAAEIDRILLAALTKARPAYLSLPTDLVFIPVDKKRLETPVVPDSVGFENHDVLPTGKKVQDEEKKRLAFVVKEIERLWDGAKDPIVLIDACSIRYGVSHLVRDLVHATKVKVRIRAPFSLFLRAMLTFYSCSSTRVRAFIHCAEPSSRASTSSMPASPPPPHPPAPPLPPSLNPSQPQPLLGPRTRL